LLDRRWCIERQFFLVLFIPGVEVARDVDGLGRRLVSRVDDHVEGVGQSCIVMFVDLVDLNEVDKGHVAWFLV
jgi:hypothetical protein